MENRIGQYRTKDLYIAALLYARGLVFSGVEREGRLCWFVFDDVYRCGQIEKGYWVRSEEVNAKAYSDAIRSLKDLVFS